MTRYRAPGCLVELSAPVLVGRAAGHHWFSSLHAVGGDILCQAIAVSDIAQGQWPGYMYRSGDDGDSWLQVQDVASVSHSSVPLKTSDETLVMPYELWPAEPGDRRNAVADGTVLSLGGNSIEARPAAVRFTDLPRDLLEYDNGELCLLTSGSIVSVDGGWLTTLYGRFEPAADELQYACMVFASTDGGFTWQFRSVVADTAHIPAASEGPNESSTVRLPDGRLLCIFRVGSGRDYPYYRSYSDDEGRTWTHPQSLAQAWSVQPRLSALDGGMLVLTGGRPGLMLWACGDGRGESWHQVNLAAHHNDCIAGDALRFRPEVVGGDVRSDPPNTSSYTSMVSTAPGEVLISYDRLSNGWHGAPGPHGDRDCVFVVRARVTPA